MIGKPKQIIVDKDALVGINIGDLCDFARNHLLLCSDTLLYECTTTSESERKNMLDRCDRLIKAGAYYCPCSVRFLQFEGDHCRPYPPFLPDLNATDDIRKACLVDKVLNSPHKIETLFSSRAEIARVEFLKLSQELKNSIDTEHPDVGKKIGQLPSDQYERFKKMFEHIDARDLRQMCVDSVPGEWIKDKAKFGLSPKWMSWQYVRLTGAIVQNYHYLRQKGGPPGNNRAEHDYQDMEYVLLLSRADCLLTGDKKLVRPLAGAAFPDKHVFSSLDEVPEDYICNWT